MKKIIFGLLIAFVALSFMGCPTAYKDLEYDPSVPVGDVVGDMNGDGFVLTAMDGVFSGYKTETFTYANDMNAWGGGNGTCNFKIRSVAGDWSKTAYGSADVLTGLLPSGVTLAGDGNITLTGLVDGTKYHFEVIGLGPKPTVSLIAD